MEQKEIMRPACIREASKACIQVCCPGPFLGVPDLQNPSFESGSAPPDHHRRDFTAATTSTLHPSTKFTNYESLPSLDESFTNFNQAYLQYNQTKQADRIRAEEYFHLSQSNNVCLDYVGQGLFSYSQQQTPIFASSSTDNYHASNVSFFDVRYKSVSLNSQILYGSDESEFESKIRKRIMKFMNISEDDYSMVFTANQSSAFKLLADSYPFHTNRNLLTVYDHESEAAEAMIQSSAKRGTCIRSAKFSWPALRIHTKTLKNMIVSKRKKRKSGLFVFPLQSRMTGARYPYLWMSMAKDNGWHVLLDANALGAKDMETLGLNLFQPDFLVSSFFKVFGENPSGFSCLFIKKSSALVFNHANISTSTGMVSLVPPQTTSIPPDDEITEIKELAGKKSEVSFSEIVEIEKTLDSTQSIISAELECRGLDHADSLGLVLISSRVRYLVNWLVNALMSLQHPHSENGLSLVRIYGPRIRIDRGPAVAFNVFDWKGEKIDPKLVEKLADRNNISICCGFLHRIWFSGEYEEERDRQLETKINEEGRKYGNERKGNFYEGIHVVTASIGFLTSFEDVYRLWAFVSRFLDADFLEKEKWRYMALNQTTVEV